VINPAMRGVGILLGIPEAKFPCDFSLRCEKQYSDHDRAVGQSSVAVPKVMDYALAVAGFPPEAHALRCLPLSSEPFD
jgi:hypothetical protein